MVGEVISDTLLLRVFDRTGSGERYLQGRVVVPSLILCAVVIRQALLQGFSCGSAISMGWQ